VVDEGCGAGAYGAHSAVCYPLPGGAVVFAGSVLLLTTWPAVCIHLYTYPRYVLLKPKPPVRRDSKADTISETGADGDSAGKGSAGGSRADTISETGADGDSAGKGSAGGSRAGGTVDGGGTVRPPRQTTSN
jgi:hypothetical protein